MTTRDPRKDPQPGDVIHINGTTWKITKRINPLVGAESDHPFCAGASMWCHIDWWVENLANAEVLHRAD